MSKFDTISYDLEAAHLDYDRTLGLSARAFGEDSDAGRPDGPRQQQLDRLAVRISALSAQLLELERDAEEAAAVTWDEDGHAGKWAHVADILY